MRITKNITEGNVYRNLILYAVPLILSAMLSQAYSTVDGMIAGKFISEHALGAISATSSYTTLLDAILNGFAAGFSIYVSHLFGKRSFASIKQEVVGMVGFAAVASVVLGVLTVLFRTPIMQYLKVDPLLWTDAERYFVIYAMGYAVFYVNSFLVYTLHALGITSFSFYTTLLSALLNVGGNLLTVLVLDMGVAGLALSTLVSAAVSTVIYVLLLRRAFREMSCERVSYRFSFAALGRSLRYSFPAAVQQLAFHGVAFLIAPAVNGLGAAATTGNSVAGRVYGFGTQSLWATASAFACYAGQCVGEGNIEKIRYGRRAGFWVVCLATLPFVLIFSCFARPVVALFFPAGYTGEAYAYAVRYATLYLPLVYVQLIGHFLHSYIRSLGRITSVLFISMAGSVARWAATVLLVPVMHIEGAFLGQVVGWGVDAVISIVLYVWLYRSNACLERIITGIRQKVGA